MCVFPKIAWFEQEQHRDLNMCFVISVFIHPPKAQVYIMPEIISVSAKEIFVVVWQTTQSKKPRWKTWISSKKFINIHHGCTSETSAFTKQLLKVLMFDTSVAVSALLLLHSWLCHKMHHISMTPADL